MNEKRELFGSRFAILMALAGSAIGLGNIWRFPYMVGEGGGAAFILIYLACSLLISLPMFVAEAVIGRRSGSNCIGAIRKLAPKSAWQILGWLSVITPLIIVSYYSVVGGWSLEFLLKSVSLSFARTAPQDASAMFERFTSGFWGPTICFTAYLAITCIIVRFGVKKGIEKFSKTAIPILFLTIILVVIYSVSLPGSKAGIDYLVKPDFSKITFKTFAFALGQSFYSLSLGMGINITYCSYMDKKEDIMKTGTYTAIFDTLFAIIAGFAIMPAVFSAGIEPGSGPGLVFRTLPYIFSEAATTMPVLSSAAAILFFVTILIAALTSSVALIEVGTAYLVEGKNFSRNKAVTIIFFGTWIVGLLCSLSIGPMSGFHIAGKPVFDFLDMFSSNFLLLIGGLLTVLFVGWKMNRMAVRDEFTNGGKLRGNGKIFNFLHFVIKYLAPVAIAVIFMSNFVF